MKIQFRLGLTVIWRNEALFAATSGPPPTILILNKHTTKLNCYQKLYIIPSLECKECLPHQTITHPAVKKESRVTHTHTAWYIINKFKWPDHTLVWSYQLNFIESYWHDANRSPNLAPSEELLSHHQAPVIIKALGARKALLTKTLQI